MKGKKICKKCGLRITPEQKAVLLLTFQGERNLEKVYWHFQCYLDWVNESLESRAMKLYNISMKNAMDRFMPMVKGIVNNGQEETNKDNLQTFRIS